PKSEAYNLYFIASLDENFSQGAKALQEYQRYVSVAPKGNYIGLAQARIKDLSVNPNKVQKIVTAAEQKKSAEAGDAYSSAIKLQQAGKLDEAIDLYKKALAVSPNEASYWYSMGTAYQAKNPPDLDAA